METGTGKQAELLYSAEGDRDLTWAHYYEQFGLLRVEPSELPPDFRKEFRTGRIATSVLSLFVRRDIRLIPMKRET